MLKPFLFVFKNLREGKGIPHGGLGTSLCTFQQDREVDRVTIPRSVLGTKEVKEFITLLANSCFHPTQWA
jgi:hypothetical protein